MAGTRDLAAIVDQATAVGAKVVLVGDHHQLPEVAAGGAFRAALDTLGDRVVELTVNRRQQNAWEQPPSTSCAAATSPPPSPPTATTAESSSPTARATSTPSSSADWHDTRRDGTRSSSPAPAPRPASSTGTPARCSPPAGELDLDRRDHFAGRGFTRRRPSRDVPKPPGPAPHRR